jgi:hypothetical protein
MSATADRIEELRAEEAAAEQRAREAEPDYWTTKAQVARENAEAVEDQLAADRRAAAIAGQAAAEEYAAAQQEMVEALETFVAAKQKIANAKSLYKTARSTAWALEAEVPVVDDLPNQTIGSTGNYELRRLLDAYAEAIAQSL